MYAWQASYYTKRVQTVYFYRANHSLRVVECFPVKDISIGVNTFTIYRQYSDFTQQPSSCLGSNTPSSAVEGNL